MTVYAKGVDYAFSHPSVASLVAGGYTFAVRYLYPFSQKPGTKNLTLAEATVLNAALADGVVSNYESWASRALDGHDAGIDDARAAQGQHTACGGKLDRPIYFSVDFDAQPAQYPAVDAYMLGVASVIGVNRTGVYGSYSTVKHRRRGFGEMGVANHAWSGGRYDERCQLSQDKNGVPLGGLNRPRLRACGRLRAVELQPGEDDMSAADVAAIIAAINTPHKGVGLSASEERRRHLRAGHPLDVAALKATRTRE